jgi:CBS domain containing-hemolysin-like protein
MRVTVLLEDRSELDRYIAGCQIGITLSSLVAGAYAQATIGPELATFLASNLSLGESRTEFASVALLLFLLTTAQVLFGELLPKSIALRSPERTALFTYVPTRLSVSAYRGLIALLNGSAMLLLRPFGVTPEGHHHVHSPEELQLLLAESRLAGTIGPELHERLERGLLLAKHSVRQIMTPRGDLVALDIELSTKTLVESALRSPYTRIPVYRKTLDQIVGALHVKDVAAWIATHGEPASLLPLIRRIPFVPETTRATQLVRFLQERGSSKAVVVDEFGAVTGIVTVEDVLYQLFGGIADELKDTDPPPVALANGNLLVPGSIQLSDAEPWLRARWEGTAATVSGHIVERLGRLPVEGETLDIDGVRFTVAQMNPTTVKRIVVLARVSRRRIGL